MESEYSKRKDPRRCKCLVAQLVPYGLAGDHGANEEQENGRILNSYCVKQILLLMPYFSGENQLPSAVPAPSVVWQIPPAVLAHVYHSRLKEP
jgi:hypothetical protein